MSQNHYNDFYDELKNGIDILSKLISDYKKKQNIEIELRLGQLQFDQFKSGIGSKKFFNKIKDVLDSAKCWDKIINNNSEELCYNGLRRTTVFNGKKIIKNQCIRKERIINLDLEYSGTPYDIRISISKEIPVEDKIKSGMGVLRKKNRYSYYYKDYVIDLTIVEQNDNGVSEIIYELEIEFLNLDNNINNKYRAHSGILLIRDIINMCENIENGSILLLSSKDLTKSLDDMQIN